MEKANWTGLALVVPRALYTKVHDREEFDRPAVYLLRGPDEEDPSGTKVYIGEADSARKRLDTHLRESDWWEEAIVFTSKDENLNKAYVRHLEARLIEIARMAKRSRLTNIQPSPATRLSEADLADAEGFLQNMLLLYPVLGVDAFELPRVREAEVTDRPLLHLKGPDCKATGRDLPEGFVVYAGALARATTVPSIHAYMAAHRERLRADGVLESAGSSLRLTQDFMFSSPSLAAAVFLGRNANGRVEWQDEDGISLKAYQESELPFVEPEGD